MNNILENNLLLIILILWGIPSTYFRSKFRKIVYKTEDWKINIMPLFTKEIKGLFLNMHSDDKNYIKVRNSYRLYLVVYVILFIVYYFYE
jgi:peroxiredoxin Q/BCP